MKSGSIGNLEGVIETVDDNATRDGNALESRMRSRSRHALIFNRRHTKSGSIGNLDTREGYAIELSTFNQPRHSMSQHDPGNQYTTADMHCDEPSSKIFNAHSYVIQLALKLSIMMSFGLAARSLPV
jgi:hypothetical protein